MRGSPFWAIRCMVDRRCHMLWGANQQKTAVPPPAHMAGPRMGPRLGISCMAAAGPGPAARQAQAHGHKHGCPSVSHTR